MEVKLIISADDSAMRFAELLGSLVSGIAITRNAPEAVSVEEKTVFVGTEPYGTFITQDMKMETAPVDEPEITKEDTIASSPVYTAEELRAVALQIPKEADKQQEVARILQSACAPDSKPSISNILPENSYQAMVRLKTLAGIN